MIGVEEKPYIDGARCNARFNEYWLLGSMNNNVEE